MLGACVSVRIKICGITRAEDLSHALESGVDALGFVFYPPSKRCLSLDQARLLGQHVPVFVTSVALFVNPDKQAVLDVRHALRPSLLQFHGDEEPDWCRSFDLPYLKAFRVGAPGLDTPDGLARTCMRYPDAAGWLFDSYTPAFGGSGQGFDLGLLEQAVASTIKRFRPWAVDVSSGVETAPGMKSREKIVAFVQSVKDSC